MDPASASPLFDLFRKGEVPREVRWLAAQGSRADTTINGVKLALANPNGLGLVMEIGEIK